MRQKTCGNMNSGCEISESDKEHVLKESDRVKLLNERKEKIIAVLKMFSMIEEHGASVWFYPDHISITLKYD